MRSSNALNTFNLASPDRHFPDSALQATELRNKYVGPGCMSKQQHSLSSHAPTPNSCSPICNRFTHQRTIDRLHNNYQLILNNWSITAYTGNLPLVQQSFINVQH